jgi:ribA/ribD-fused uncharacterized protein
MTKPEQVTVVNVYKCKETFIRIDRSTVLGNPFPRTPKEDRDTVCDKYEKWFLYKTETRDPEVMTLLNKILTIAKKQPVNIGCYCKQPNRHVRCHGDAIKKWLDEQLEKTSVIEPSIPVDKVPAFRGEFFFLSNMFPYKIVYLGRLFTCAEAAFQASKCRFPSDIDLFTPLNGFEAKKLGTSICLREDWDSVKADIMKEILVEKFSDLNLGRMLKELKGELVERNAHNDQFWGVCKGHGKNILGKLLMEIRDVSTH